MIDTGPARIPRMSVSDLPATRRRLQRALLAVLRGDSPGMGLADLQSCLAELEAGAGVPAARELWATGGELVSGLRSDDDPPDQASLRLLGQLDRALRTQIQAGEEALEDASFDELANAFRRHPRSLASAAVEPSQPPPEALAGLAAAMASLSSHAAWSGQARGASSAPVRPAAQEQESTSAPAAAAPISMTPVQNPADRVALANTFSRLGWVARQAARDLGRPVELHCSGNALVPRERMRPLLPHLECLVRNAIYLGVASPEERREAGLPRLARLQLAVRQEGAGAWLEVGADGLAVDLKRLRRRAVESGLLADSDVSSSEQLAVLLQRGFSTAHRATQVAGYGVGLDAASEAFATVGGQLRLSLAATGGLRIEMSVPG